MKRNYDMSHNILFCNVYVFNYAHYFIGKFGSGNLSSPLLIFMRKYSEIAAYSKTLKRFQSRRM